MEKLFVSSAFFGTSIAFLFGEWTPFMAVLLAISGLDIFTGIAKGIYDKQLRSRKMYQGMIRKSMIWVVIALGNLIDLALFGGIPVAKTGAIFFYIGMEGLSVAENLGQMNMTLPKFIKDYLEVLKDKGENPKIPANQIKRKG